MVALRNDELNKRTFYWHAPGWYVLILVSVVIYAIAALIACKRSSHVLGMCAAPRRRRNRFILLTAGAFVAGPLLGSAIGGEAGVWLGLGLFLVMLVVSLLGARILVPWRMDERYARYKGVAPTFWRACRRYGAEPVGSTGQALAAQSLHEEAGAGCSRHRPRSTARHCWCRRAHSSGRGKPCSSRRSALPGSGSIGTTGALAAGSGWASSPRCTRSALA